MARSAKEWKALLPTVKVDVANALAAAGFEDQDDDDPSWADIPSTWAKPGSHHPRCYPDAFFDIHISLSKGASSRINDIRCAVSGGTPAACPDAVYMHGDDGLDLESVVAGAEVASEATRLDVVSERDAWALIGEVSREVGVPPGVAVVKGGVIEVNVRVVRAKLDGLLRYVNESGIMDDYDPDYYARLLSLL